jgi:hypothetical protein
MFCGLLVYEYNSLIHISFACLCFLTDLNFLSQFILVAVQPHCMLYAFSCHIRRYHGQNFTMNVQN